MDEPRRLCARQLRRLTFWARTARGYAIIFPKLRAGETTEELWQLPSIPAHTAAAAAGLPALTDLSLCYAVTTVEPRTSTVEPRTSTAASLSRGTASFSRLAVFLR